MHNSRFGTVCNITLESQEELRVCRSIGKSAAVLKSSIAVKSINGKSRLDQLWTAFSSTPSLKNKTLL